MNAEPGGVVSTTLAEVISDYFSTNHLSFISLWSGMAVRL